VRSTESAIATPAVKGEVSLDSPTAPKRLSNGLQLCCKPCPAASDKAGVQGATSPAGVLGQRPKVLSLYLSTGNKPAAGLQAANECGRIFPTLTGSAARAVDGISTIKAGWCV